MAIIRCPNCHLPFDSTSPHWTDVHNKHFCSQECSLEYEQKMHNQFVMQGLLASQRRQERVQAELQRQQAQQELAIAQAQAAAEQAEKNALLQKYGFNNASEAEKFIQKAIQYHNCSEDDDYETKLQKAEIEHKQHLEWEKEYNAERDKKIKERNELISSLMNEDQKEKYASIENFSEKSIDKDHSAKTILLMVLFPILWIIAYKLFLERFLYRFGFWSSLIAFIGLGGIIIYFLGKSSIKMKINKIAKIKGTDSFPFYPVSSADFCSIPNDLAFRNGLCTIGISILIAVAIFKLFKYMYVPYLGVILRIFSIIGIVVALVLCFVNTSIDDHKVTKNNITFESLTYYYQYKIIQYAREKLGTFLLNPDYFSEWQKASNPWEPKESYWLYTFLPEQENQEFTEKYGNLSGSGINSIEKFANFVSGGKNNNQISTIETESAYIKSLEDYIKMRDSNSEKDLSSEELENSKKDYDYISEHEKENFGNPRVAELLCELYFGSSEKGTHGKLYFENKKSFKDKKDEYYLTDELDLTKLAKIEENGRTKAKVQLKNYGKFANLRSNINKEMADYVGGEILELMYRKDI